MLILAYPSTHACRRIGRIPPHAAIRQAALPHIIRARKQQRILPRAQPARYRRQRQVVVPVRNRRRPISIRNLKRGRSQLHPKSHRLVSARSPAQTALVLPDSLVLIERIHRPRERISGRGIYRQRSTKNRAPRYPHRSLFRRTIPRSQPRPRLTIRKITHPRPSQPIRRLVVPVIPHRRHKHSAHRIPHHRRRRISIWRRKPIRRPLQILPVLVRNPCQVPRCSAVLRIIQTLHAPRRKPRIHQRSLIRLAYRRHHQLHIRRTPREACEPLSHK